MIRPGDEIRHLILFVDDEEKTCKYFARIFESEFKVVTAISAEEAWHVAADLHEELAVVISDQRMPGAQGTELLQKFEREYPDIVRILTTAYTDLTSAVEAVNVGRVYEYVAKPWEIDDLRNSIRRAVEIYALRRDHKRLLGEKLSVVQRMICLDRIRSLSVLATSMTGTIKHAKAALSSYVQQAPLRQRIELELENAAMMDLSELVKLESVNMLQSIQDVRSKLFENSIEDESDVDVHEFMRDLLQKVADEKADDGVKISTELKGEKLNLRSVRWMLESLFKMLVDRIADMSGDDIEIQVTIGNESNSSTIELAVNTPPWDRSQVTALFSALMPIQKWPLGQDMDMMAAFFAGHHLGGGIQIDPAKPGFSVTLGEVGHCSEPVQDDPHWFGGLLKCLDMWKQESDFEIFP